MAASKSIRGAAAPARIRPSASAKPAAVQPLPDPMRRHLESLLLALRDIEATVIVAVGALREENAFAGMCAARVLRTQVSNRLSLEIERATEAFAIGLKTDQEYES